MKARSKAAPRGAQPKTRSYGLNDPTSFVVEEWPQSKRDLYEAARVLFWQKGFAETSVQDIVEGAKLTKGAFYHYFDAKEDLLRVMYERSLERILRVVQSGISEDLPIEQAFSTLVEAMVNAVVDYRVEVALFWEQYRRMPPDLVANNVDRRREFIEVATSMIKRGIKRGELVKMQSPRVAAQALIGMCQFAQFWYRPGGAMNTTQVGQFYAHLFLHGALKR